MIRKVLWSALLATTMFAKVGMEFGVNVVGMSMDYKEYKDGVLLDSESSGFSDLKGAEFIYKYTMDDAASLDTDVVSMTLLALSGDTKYIGSYIGSNLGYGSLVSTTNNEVYDLDLDFAHSYHYSQDAQVIFSLGVGYRFWRRSLSAQQVEDYKWYSLRPSLVLSYTYKSLTFTPKFEYQYGLRPRMRASGFNSEFKLGGANIMQLNLPLAYKLNQNFSLFAAYVYEYQKIRESDIVYDNSGSGYLEPQSKAYNEYIKFGLLFKY